MLVVFFVKDKMILLAKLSTEIKIKSYNLVMVKQIVNVSQTQIAILYRTIFFVFNKRSTYGNSVLKSLRK